MSKSHRRSTEQSTFTLGDEATKLPSAKQRFKARSIPSPWGRFLAAFSQRFAQRAIEMLCPKGRGLLFDPFVGSGTTLVAAAQLGVAAIGNDLDPVAAVISRGRISYRCKPKRVQELLNASSKTSGTTFSSSARDYFAESDLEYAASVISKLRRSVPKVDGSTLSALLADEAGEHDSEAIALAALVNAARNSAKVVRGSNPVWQRKAVPGERIKTRPLAEIANETATLMVNELISSQRLSPGRQIRILFGDARDALVPDNSVDAVLTSPPYLNRLDYVVNHLPQLLILTGLHAVDFEQLRLSMTGTTKIVNKAAADSRVGSTCEALLEAIRQHPSYASERYYSHIYVQYFNDMLRVFAQLKRQCRPGARGIMVVQTSYYKNLLIDPSRIFQEMANNLGFQIQPVASEEVAVHYGNLSPRQLKYVPNKRLREWMLGLEF